MVIPARLLNTSCIFEVRTGAKSTTSGQVNYTWATAQSGVPCRIDEASGQEYKAQSGTYVRATHILFVNRGAVSVAISEGEHRVKIGTTTYDILLIADAGGQGHHYEIALERVY